MGEPASWTMKVRGERRNVLAFARMMYETGAAEKMKKGEFSPSPQLKESDLENSIRQDLQHPVPPFFPLTLEDALELLDYGYSVCIISADGDIIKATRRRALKTIATGNRLCIPKEEFEEMGPVIKGAAYDGSLEIGDIVDLDDGSSSLQIQGTCNYDLSPMVEGPCRKGELLLQDAAKNLALDIEAFGHTWSTFDQQEFHLYITRYGALMANEGRPCMHEYRSTFDDLEELVECAGPALKEIGRPITIEDPEEAERIIAEYTDEDGYVDISPFSGEFSI